MSISKKTLIEDLSFPNSWRLRRSINHHNRGIDKKDRIETVDQLINSFNEEQLKSLLGVGPKTVRYFMEALNEER